MPLMCWATSTQKARCDMDDQAAESHPAGTVRHKAGSHWIVTSPREPLYSTALMCATERWAGWRWVPINEDEEDSSI